MTEDFLTMPAPLEGPPAGHVLRYLCCLLSWHDAGFCFVFSKRAKSVGERGLVCYHSHPAQGRHYLYCKTECLSSERMSQSQGLVWGRFPWRKTGFAVKLLEIGSSRLV